MDTARMIMRHTDEAMLREVYCRPRPVDLVSRVASFQVEVDAAEVEEDWGEFEL